MPQVYSAYAWVKKAVSLIADNIASLPVRVVDGNDKELLSHPLSLLLANVNDEDAPAQLWRAYTVNMLLGGETFYQFVPDGRGRPAEIWMRRPDQIAVLPDVSRLNYPTAAAYQFTGEDNQTIDISPDQMAHDKFYNPLSPWRGLAPIHAAREGITIDLYARAYRKLFFRSSARPDYAIIAPQGITETEKNRTLSEILRQHQGTEKAHLPLILEQGVTDIKVLSFPGQRYRMAATDGV
jgi:HK97 family phage portal protein